MVLYEDKRVFLYINGDGLNHTMQSDQYDPISNFGRSKGDESVKIKKQSRLGVRE